MSMSYESTWISLSIVLSSNYWVKWTVTIRFIFVVRYFLEDLSFVRRVPPEAFKKIALIYR